MVGTYFCCLMFISNSQSFALFLTFWICTAFCLRISGGHFNAAISFAFSLRKETGTLSRKLAVWYMAFQCFGSLLAGFTCVWILGGVPVARPNLYPDPLPNKPLNMDNDWFRAVLQEMFGTFCFVFFYLS